MDDTTQDEVGESVTPVMLREVAGRAEALAKMIDGLHALLRLAGDESTQRTGFQLPNAAGQARRVAVQLLETADDLSRIRARSDCVADWGVCPQHGGTLHSSGGQSWCPADGCRRRGDTTG